jgi:hypothetical protein
MYPYGSEKEIKVYPVAFSCIYEHEKEQRLSSVCPQLESWWLDSRMIIKGWRHAPQASTTASYSIDISLETDLSINDKFM